MAPQVAWGKRLCQLITESARVALVGAVEHRDSPAQGARIDPGDETSPIVQNADGIDVLADVVIDFSHADAVQSAISCARRAQAALLVGTTGMAPSMMDELRAESTKRAILVAPNTSLGVSSMVRVVSEAAKLLGDAYGCSIFEAHHAAKRDAPSGTAKRLRDAILGVGADVDNVHVIRAGDTIGEHTVRFDGPGETILITHRAVTRDLFVDGAIHAATWLSRQAPGFYTMEDVLGFATS